MARLWARTTTYESVNPGDELPILVKWETADTIANFAALLQPEPPATSGDSGLEAAPAANDRALPRPSAPDGEGKGPALPPEALVSYVMELLEKGFPLTCLVAKGSRLELQSLAPVLAEDTLSLSGWVTGKEESAGQRLVECRVLVEKQGGTLAAEAIAVIAL